MPSASDSPQVREYRVVCRGEGTSAYILHRAAPDPSGAMESARRAGHDPYLCFPFGLSRKDETRILDRLRHGLKECPNCAYSLTGLPSGPCWICPECGMGAAPDRPRIPRCGVCGYCMSGIAVGSGPVRCPECGSASPFI